MELTVFPEDLGPQAAVQWPFPLQSSRLMRSQNPWPLKPGLVKALRDPTHLGALEHSWAGSGARVTDTRGQGGYTSQFRGLLLKVLDTD